MAYTIQPKIASHEYNVYKIGENVKAGELKSKPIKTISKSSRTIVW